MQTAQSSSERRTAVKFNHHRQLTTTAGELVKSVAERERDEMSFTSTNDSTAFLLIIKKTIIRCIRQRRAAGRLYSHRVMISMISF